MALRFLISQKDTRAIGKDNLEILESAYSAYLSPVEAEIDLSLVSLPEIQEINRTSRSIEEPTDVLSFPLFPDKEAILSVPEGIPTLIGSIVISPEKALQYDETLPQLVHHGLLHICGFDHETDIMAWRAEETALLEDLSAYGLIIPGISL